MATRVLKLFLFLALIALAIPVRGQSTYGTISGTVEDATKALIPGVMVTAANVNTGVVSMGITNETGAYNIPALLPGQYKVSASPARSILSRLPRVRQIPRLWVRPAATTRSQVATAGTLSRATVHMNCRSAPINCCSARVPVRSRGLRKAGNSAESLTWPAVRLWISMQAICCTAMACLISSGRSLSARNPYGGDSTREPTRAGPFFRREL